LHGISACFPAQKYSLYMVLHCPFWVKFGSPAGQDWVTESASASLPWRPAAVTPEQPDQRPHNGPRSPLLCPDARKPGHAGLLPVVMLLCRLPSVRRLPAHPLSISRQSASHKRLACL